MDADSKAQINPNEEDTDVKARKKSKEEDTDVKARKKPKKEDTSCDDDVKVNEQYSKRIYCFISSCKDIISLKIRVKIPFWNTIYSAPFFEVIFWMCLICILLFLINGSSKLKVDDYNKHMLDWKREKESLDELSWHILNSTLYRHIFMKPLKVSPIFNVIGHPDNIRRFTNKLEIFLYATFGISKCRVFGRNSAEIAKGTELSNAISSIVGYDPKNLNIETRKHKIAGCVLIKDPGEMPEDTLKTMHVLTDDVESLFPDVVVVLGVPSNGTEVVDKSVYNTEFKLRAKRVEMYYRRYINETKSVSSGGEALIARLLVNFIQV